MADTSNGKSVGVMMCARRAKTGIKTDGDVRETRKSNGDGKYRGDGQTFVIRNYKNRDGNPNARTYAQGGD